jgi:hypothetical protein
MLCGGCLEDGCVHVREQESKVNRSQAKCLFCEMKHIDDSCPTLNPPPPKQFECAPPHILGRIIALWNREREEYTDNPPEPDWPLIIPEVSDITETTSRLGPWPDEGEWKNEKWDPVAWDMTGYLFDKIQGAPWVRDPEFHQEEDWHFILGGNENWISNILLVDRLPDRLAIQTPPTGIITAYLNRIYAYQWPLIVDEDAPRPWLLTHGYPSYIDWPPAWHWNLGIRMLGSLAAYIGAQNFELMGIDRDAWYPDRSRQTTQYLRLPFVDLLKEYRLLFTPGSLSYGPTEMDWDYFPGIIPFIPGADTNQLTWFTKQISEMGYTTVALDAVNSIAHENFKALREAVPAVRKGGAKHVLIYGPWPLHPPSKDISIHHVSYIPTALHMDMTNKPPRYWHDKREKPDGTKRKWQRLPNYRKANLTHVHHLDFTETCECPACQAAKVHESDPRSIWRWGHMLHAGLKWQKRMEKKKQKKEEPELSDENTRLWYQGPSYTVFRKCLHYPPEIHWPGIEDILETLVFTETKMEVRFPDGETAPAHMIQWTWLEEGHHWRWKFPLLEE